MRVLITGSSGFVGTALVRKLIESQRFLVRTAHRVDTEAGGQGEKVVIGDISRQRNFETALKDVNTVVHLAARVHILGEDSASFLDDYRRVNVDATLDLARQAARIGVRRFLFMSSIKVNGEGTLKGQPYTESHQEAPVGPYAISKCEAERGLRQVSAATGMEVVIIRPPLVYGPGVRANFHKLMKWVQKGIPLPFGAIDNRRSMVATENLVDLIATCLKHPLAANETFLVSDGEDISTTQLLQRVAQALNVPSRLLPVPAWLLDGMATALGKGDLTHRLCGSLQVDIGKARSLLGWAPPISLEAALRATARHFLSHGQM